MESITVFTKTDEQHSVCSKREHPDEDLAVLTLCKPLMFTKGTLSFIKILSVIFIRIFS